MSDPQHSILGSQPADLRQLLDEAASEEQLWSSDDLRDVFSHQWAAPLAVDLSGLEETLSSRVEALAVSKGLLLRSFGDLLAHPRPPLELLVLTKEFAKRSLSSPHSTIPHDVARVLYFASIAVALGRCGRRISRLDDSRVLEGISWALSRGWLSQDARDVLSEGLEALKKAGKQPS